MSTIRKLKSGNYNVNIRIQGHKPVSKTFPSLFQAELWSKETEDRIKDCLNNTSNSGLQFVIDEYLTRRLTNYDGTPKSSHHAFTFRGKSLVKYLGDIPLRDITTGMISSYRDYRLKSGRAEATVHGEMAFLGRLFDFASIDLDIPNLVNVAKKVKKPSGSKQRDVVINKDELITFVAHTPAKYRNYLKVLFYTCSRKSELLHLPVEWIHLDEQIIKLPDYKTKTKTKREVLLNKEVIAILEEEISYSKIRGENTLFNFVSGTVSEVFRKVAEKLGYEGLVLHSLRHSGVTHYAKKGLSTVALRSITGHKSLISLNRYVKNIPKETLPLMDD
ncbi:site-specific integrase [Thalassotalea fonticola]|uniref:Site-specific integrase n=1 Tax=Thalassotalea fonticola TaxID=3065649 RepID=A0ABZ0GT53_9GAMM|nr:site-specific integrase [Colwelliaceae bacterium S1-1]